MKFYSFDSLQTRLNYTFIYYTFSIFPRLKNVKGFIALYVFLYWSSIFRCIPLVYEENSIFQEACVTAITQKNFHESWWKIKHSFAQSEFNWTFLFSFTSFLWRRHFCDFWEEAFLKRKLWGCSLLWISSDFTTLNYWIRCNFNWLTI